MYYKPDHFQPQEVFPPETIQDNLDSNGVLKPQIWRLMDWRILWTADRINEHFQTTVVVNDYLWGGDKHYRGYRPIAALIDVEYFKETGIIKTKWSSFTTQHGSGRGLDCNFGSVSVDEVREDIKNHPNADRYKYITAIEKNVSWLHIDCRSWDVSQNGILFF